MSEYYYILDHFEKWIPNFNREQYENATKEELIEIGRPYFDTHPVAVTAWYSVNEPDEKLIYREGLGKQMVFVRDKICKNLFFEKEYSHLKPFDDEWHDAIVESEPKVISTHYSKSVKLPVMEINLPSVNVKMVLRYNFYDWNVSVESETPIDCDFKGTFKDGKCWCEGFPKDRIYGNYKDDHKKFTVEIHSDYELFVFMWLLRDYLYTN